MKIYAVGDSFTAGSELMDWKYYDDFPGYITAAEKDSNISQGKINWYNNRTYLHRLVGGLSSPGYQQVLEEEKSRTYANQLAEILDIAVTNQGIGGCSQQTVRRNLFLYLDNLVEDHCVFFQPTGPTRYCQYQMGSQKGFWRDFIAGYAYENTSKELQAYTDFKILNETDYSWHLEWWINFTGCISLIENHPRVQKYFIVDSGVINHINKNIQQRPEDFTEDNLGSRISRQIQELYSKDLVVRFPFTRDEPVICPGGHFNHIVHRRLAEQLAEKINN
jgi:hypothetical protein